MKCELCHQKDAETAIQVEKDGVADELYVCRECANKERVRRQKKSQRTRKMTGLPPGVSMSVTQIGGEGSGLTHGLTGGVQDIPVPHDVPLVCHESGHR